MFHNILDNYVKSAPSPQNALDIFQGEWASRMPGALSGCQAGGIELFADARIKWFLEEIGGVQGKSVLEPGPLEDGHSYMLGKAGAERVVAIESNTRACLKYLITKELLGLLRVQLLCGDFLNHLRNDGATYEVRLASGVLYHMQNPAELILLLAKHCAKHLLVWTHYYDATIISVRPHWTANSRIPPVASMEDFGTRCIGKNTKRGLTIRDSAVVRRQ